METRQPIPEQSLPEVQEQSSAQPSSKLWIFLVIGVLLFAGLIVGAIFLFKAEAATTSHIRDIFIIFMALESLVLGVALVILIIQMATLINLIHNEIEPIMRSTAETVNTLRGTTTFLSENMVKPIIKANEYSAGIKRLFDVIRRLF